MRKFSRKAYLSKRFSAKLGSDSQSGDGKLRNTKNRCLCGEAHSQTGDARRKCIPKFSKMVREYERGDASQYKIFGGYLLFFLYCLVVHSEGVLDPPPPSPGEA